MTHDEALELLQSANPRERLEAARYLERAATPEDAETIRNARQAETVSWIRNALARALNLASMDSTLLVEDDGPSPAAGNNEHDEVYATATREIADQLVHELAPLVGAARLHALKELGDKPHSKTRRDLERIDAVLQAIDELARASSACVMQDINIADPVAEAVATISEDRGVEIQLASADPFPAVGDPALVLIATRNGLANAVDAVASLPVGQRSPVVISWGRGGHDYRVSVLDRGPGLPADVAALLEFGVTTKGDNHPGLGLALAQRAALSLGGSLTIANSDPSGVLFELRWPRPE